MREGAETKLEVPESLLKLERLRLDHLRDQAITQAYTERRKELRDAIAELNRRDAHLFETEARVDKAQFERNERTRTVLRAQLRLVEEARKRADATAGPRDLFRNAQEAMAGTLLGWGLKEWT